MSDALTQYIVDRTRTSAPFVIKSVPCLICLRLVLTFALKMYSIWCPCGSHAVLVSPGH